MGRRLGLVCCYRCTKAHSSANSTLKYVFLSCKSRYALWCKVRKLFPKYVDNTGYFRNYASNFPLFTFRTFTPYVLLPINLIGGRVSAFYGRKLAPTYPIKLRGSFGKWLILKGFPAILVELSGTNFILLPSVA